MRIKEANKGNPEVYSKGAPRPKCGKLSHFISILMGFIKDGKIPASKRLYLKIIRLGNICRCFAFNPIWKDRKWDLGLYLVVRWNQESFKHVAHLHPSRVADKVDMVVVSFDGNMSLLVCPPWLRSLVPGRTKGTILNDWSAITSSIPAIHHVTIQQIMGATDLALPRGQNWRSYINNRYGE